LILTALLAATVHGAYYFVVTPDSHLAVLNTARDTVWKSGDVVSYDSATVAANAWTLNGQDTTDIWGRIRDSIAAHPGGSGDSSWVYSAATKFKAGTAWRGDTAVTDSQFTTRHEQAGAYLAIGGKAADAAGADSADIGVVSRSCTGNAATATKVAVRSVDTTSTATPTPNCDLIDQYDLTALGAATAFGAPTGTPVNGQKLIIRLHDDGTARALTWNAAYRSRGATLLTTTTPGVTNYLGFIYNSVESKWDCEAAN
jgi:hypothetical protein